MYPICISGIVVEGLKQARELGYPTANLKYTFDDGQSLEHGVYVGRVRGIIEHDPLYEYAAAIVVGGDFVSHSTPKIEAYIIDYSGDLYTRKLTFILLKKIRPLERFDSVDTLKDTISNDVHHIRQFFALSR